MLDGMKFVLAQARMAMDDRVSVPAHTRCQSMLWR
jgi:hypothetical protein